jgi:hypothetical protein
MLREKGQYRMNLSITGSSREDCVKQLGRNFFPQGEVPYIPPQKVALSKLELVKAVHNYSRELGQEGGLIEAKRFVERNYPQFDRP